MFCDRCGAQLEAGASFCRACGKPVGGVPALPSQTSISGHVRLLGILWIAISAFRLLPALVLFGVSRNFMSEMGVPSFVHPLLATIGTFFALFAALGFIAGWGLLEHAPWSRMLAIVMGCLALIDIPFGTALGIYTLWVLLPAKAETEFRQISAQ